MRYINVNNQSYVVSQDKLDEPLTRLQSFITDKIQDTGVTIQLNSTSYTVSTELIEKSLADITAYVEALPEGSYNISIGNRNFSVGGLTDEVDVLVSKIVKLTEPFVSLLDVGLLDQNFILA